MDHPAGGWVGVGWNSQTRTEHGQLAACPSTSEGSATAKFLTRSKLAQATYQAVFCQRTNQAVAQTDRLFTLRGVLVYVADTYFRQGSKTSHIPMLRHIAQPGSAGRPVDGVGAEGEWHG